MSALTGRARDLRIRMTDAERQLWQMLRGGQLGAKFRHQHPMGYIPDFVCVERRLIVEADGSQHLNSEYDRERDAFFAALGFRTLRFWNSEILKNLNGVLEVVAEALENPHPGPPFGVLRAPPKGEGLG